MTSDNPRTENPISIIEDILRGVHRDSDYTVVPNRREAIACALSIAREGDTVMLCGKGHETYQITGDTRTHFDDKEEARKALGMALPGEDGKPSRQ